MLSGKKKKKIQRTKSRKIFTTKTEKIESW